MEKGAENAEEDVSFSSVAVVATGWMFDFMFVSLCRHFKESKLEEFSELITTFESLSECSSLRGNLHREKRLICAFLARVLHGEQLDVLFEQDSSVTPLMSAAKVWSGLERAAADDGVFKQIKGLLLVQSVAVSMKGGQKPNALSVLKWFENNQGCPQSLLLKLSKLVSQKDTYNSFFTGFSFSCLLEKVRSFVDAYLERNPSDHLLKAATETVQSSFNGDDLQDVTSQESSSSETTSTSVQKHKRTKRKLLPTKITDIWKPDPCRIPTVSVKKMADDECPEMRSESPVVHKKRKPRAKWTAKLDNHLKEGVRRHGVGKWGRIAMDYDFEGRTGTMLKDRWRILVRTYKV